MINENSKLKSELTSKSESLKRADIQNNNYKTEINTLKTKIESLNSSISSGETNLASIIETDKNKIRSLTRELDFANRQISELKTAHAKELQAMELKMANKEKYFLEHSKLELPQDYVAEVKTNLASKYEIINLKNDLEYANKEVSKSQSKIANLKQEFEKLVEVVEHFHRLATKEISLRKSVEDSKKLETQAEQFHNARFPPM